MQNIRDTDTGASDTGLSETNIGVDADVFFVVIHFDLLFLLFTQNLYFCRIVLWLESFYFKGMTFLVAKVNRLRASLLRRSKKVKVEKCRSVRSGGLFCALCLLDKLSGAGE